MKQPFAFAFYLTHWRDDLAHTLHLCLLSLQRKGGDASSYPRYLIFSGEVTPAVDGFCREHGLQIRLHPRWTVHFTLPNRTLVCQVPEHEVVCLLDTDIVFLDNPTPMFRRVAETGHLYSRPDISLPYREWPRLPERWQSRLNETVGKPLWEAQYRRFSGDRSLEVPALSRPGGGTLPPYFNGGVHFVPGHYLSRLGSAWQRICAALYRDDRLRRPYTFLFQSYYFEMMSFALALYRERIPWTAMPSSHNLMPVSWAPPEDLARAREGDVVMVHLVREMRHWYTPNAAIPEASPLALLRDRVHEAIF